MSRTTVIVEASLRSAPAPDEKLATRSAQENKIGFTTRNSRFDFEYRFT
jgi:hypothetical protein